MSVPLKPEECHLILLSPTHTCPRHSPWKCLRTAKPCKGETRVPYTIIGTNQLRETTPTENPRSSKVAGVEHKASNLVSENLTCKNSRQRNESLIIRRQPTRVKRIRKDTIYVGTWNIITMFKAGKMNEIADEILKTQLQIIALQELRWKGVGQINKTEYILYYSCNL